MGEEKSRSLTRTEFEAVMKRLRQGGFMQGPLIVECLKVGDLALLHTEAQQARKFIETLINV
jgi:hypothetical protein